MYRKDDWADDALIGLDVGGETSSRRNKVDVGSTSKPSRKRPRQSNIISSTTRPQKPKPPPAPPASLVSLMKKDKSVLHYFKSLHENTTYDVDKWKHEAAYWKRMASSATKTKIAGGTKTSSAKKRQRKSINGRQKKQNIVEGKGNGEDEEGSTIPITDEALFEEFSDDDDGDDDKDDVKRSTASSAKGNECNNNTTNSHSTTEEQSMRRRSLIFGKLLQAKQYLDLLGVSLVVIEVKPSFPNEMIKQSNDEGKTEADTSEEQTDDTALPSERILHRRSDEKVVADMMAWRPQKNVAFQIKVSYHSRGKQRLKIQKCWAKLWSSFPLSRRYEEVRYDTGREIECSGKLFRRLPNRRVMKVTRYAWNDWKNWIRTVKNEQTVSSPLWNPEIMTSLTAWTN